MKVTVKKEIIEGGAPPKKWEKWLGRSLKDTLRWRGDMTINLADRPVDDAAGFLELIGDQKTRGAARLRRDVETWIAVRKGEKKVARARTVEMAADLLIAYFSRTPRKHVYTRNEDGMVCYYIDKIRYHPPERSRGYSGPAAVSLRLAWEEFGEIKTTSEYLLREHTIGKTVIEMLTSQDLLPETAALRLDYQYYVERYQELHDQVGRQCIAVGKGSTKGIDGNGDDEDYWWRRSEKLYRLDDGGGTRVVIDIFKEEADRDRGRSRETVDHYFWDQYGRNEDDEDDDETEEVTDCEIPVHPYLVIFDLKRHKRMKVHIDNLTEYEYDETLGDKLVLPMSHASLIDTLLLDRSEFHDVVAGKTGGTIILCQGPPGTGKTLTAEVYAESMKKPLYNVQCAQLGTEAETLEGELLKAFARARRWKAVMLLDEADVYVHRRGDDLEQNAIVGVFLRVLEYHASVLFMTTNRADLVDDAILSRCTARIPYGPPSKAHQKKLWRLMAELNDHPIEALDVDGIVAKHDGLSGRDIKNLFKLAQMIVAIRTDNIIDADLITELKAFKPTIDAGEQIDN